MQCYDIRVAPVPIRLWYGTGSSPSHIPHYLTVINFFAGRTWSLIDKIILTTLTLDNLIILFFLVLNMPLIIVIIYYDIV